MIDRQKQRDELSSNIIAQVRREIDGVLDEAELPTETREQITKDLIAGTERILDALSLAELGSQLAFERYLETCAHDARLEIRRRQYTSKTTTI
jgi:hypothetical protein